MSYILSGFVILFVAGLLLLAFIFAIARISESDNISEKEKMAAEKLRTQKLRGDRLQRDLDVVSNRAILVSNQAVLADLRIEKARRDLGMASDTFVPTNS